MSGLYVPAGVGGERKKRMESRPCTMAQYVPHSFAVCKATIQSLCKLRRQSSIVSFENCTLNIDIVIACAADIVLGRSRILLWSRVRSRLQRISRH
jgi:hypothetical protein